MIYIILSFIFLFLMLLFKSTDGDSAVVFSVFLIVCIIVSIMSISSGYWTYYDLRSEYVSCISYKQTITETVDIYNSEVPIQSLKQLTEYSEMVSKYNKKLTIARMKKESKLFWWFGESAFISNKIFDLKEIK